MAGRHQFGRTRNWDDDGWRVEVDYTGFAEYAGGLRGPSRFSNVASHFGAKSTKIFARRLSSITWKICPINKSRLSRRFRWGRYSRVSRENSALAPV